MVAAGYEDGIAVHLGCTFIVLIVKRDEKHLTYALLFDFANEMVLQRVS